MHVNLHLQWWLTCLELRTLAYACLCAQLDICMCVVLVPSKTLGAIDKLAEFAVSLIPVAISKVKALVHEL